MSHEQQFWPREPIRCMYPDEIKRLVREHRHPSFLSCGVLRSHHGDLNREASNLVPHGTVWFYAPKLEYVYTGFNTGFFEDRGKVREAPLTVPANCIPYHTIKTAAFDDKTGRFEGGELLRGWRNFFSQLVKQGYLRGSPKLTYLIGEDTLLSSKPKNRIYYLGDLYADESF